MLPQCHTLHSLKSTRKSHSFYNIRPCANDIVHARFEDVSTFLYVFLSLVKASVRYELWVNVVFLLKITKRCGVT